MSGVTSELGKMLVAIGIVCLVLGGALFLGGRLPLGRLPGDIFIRRERYTLLFPIATSVVVSLLLSLVLWIRRR